MGASPPRAHGQLIIPSMKSGWERRTWGFQTIRIFCSNMIIRDVFLPPSTSSPPQHQGGSALGLGAHHAPTETTEVTRIDSESHRGGTFNGSFDQYKIAL